MPVSQNHWTYARHDIFFFFSFLILLRFLLVLSRCPWNVVFRAACLTQPDPPITYKAGRVARTQNAGTRLAKSGVARSQGAHIAARLSVHTPKFRQMDLRTR
ncbi:hypothetical protein LZ32DRAFT_602279 [Colletotrichum eremochloae]|nr:hypothetical protein LZ32DRAFT_602279 [Colletotrichum eremochloae]